MSDRGALLHYTRPLTALLGRSDISEICINRPGEVWLEAEQGWMRVASEWATFEWAAHFARLVASASQQRISSEHPLLSAALPDGARVQVVLPPATERDTVAIAIRRNRCVGASLAGLIGEGLSADCRRAGEASCPQSVLASAYSAGDWLRFLKGAVHTRQNVLVSGATGSGKTTLTRALIGEIDASERLVTIEDTPELELPTGRNTVQLYYSKDGQGLSRLTPRHLLEACLRLRPERILLAELRGDEAYQYLRAVNSGHPGSITSIHASSCRLAFEQLALLVKESESGRDMPRADVHALLRQVIDVIVHCERRAGRRIIGEIWWRGASATA